MRDYQRQIKLNRLSDLAMPISWQVRLLERAGASPDQIALFLRDRAVEMDVRILLVDTAGQVVEDTDGSLRGNRIIMPPAWQRRENPDTIDSVAFIREASPGIVFIVAQTRAAPPTDRFLTRVPSYFVALAVPEQSLTSSWLELAPRLSFAGLVSMIVSIGVALLLSRSISKPIAEITRASEEMARGNFDQNIQVRSRDEVGRLAEAFNHMARQVSISHRTLRDFLANVSHDLRTPLTSVQGFSQAMLDGTVKTPEEYAEAAQIINDESSRMRRMVEDLLLLSKIESGQMPLDRSELDLRDLLQACVKRAGPQAQLGESTLVLEADQPVQMVGDEGRLEEVFRNLLDNAVRHTPSGGAITVKLSVDPVAAPHNGARENGNGEIRVVVHNTGSYIPPEDQSRVFERFYQVDKSRSRNGDGSGLGLAIAREIVHLHGGTITVESDPTTGTSFTLTFPRRPTVESRSQLSEGLQKF
ncbi:MAG: sensor histidine kinase [Sphingomonadaceae bacterium]